MTTTSSNSSTHASPFRVNAALAYVYVVWGGTYLAVHFAIQTIPPFLLTGLRFFTAGVILMALLRVIHPRQFAWGTAREWRDAFCVGFLLLVSGIGAVNWAQQYTSSSMAALIFGAIPLWIALVDWIRPYGKAPRARTAFGLLLGFAGVCLLMAPGGAGQPTGSLFANIVLMLAGLSWASGAIYSRHTHVQGSAFLPMSRQMISAGLVLMLVAAWHGDWARFSIGAVTPVSWLAIAYLVLCGSVTGFTAYIWLMRVCTTARVSTIPYVNLVIAVLLGWSVGHEVLNWRMGVGAAVIVASVILVIQAPRWESPPSD